MSLSRINPIIASAQAQEFVSVRLAQRYLKLQCAEYKKNMFGDVTLRIPTDLIKQQQETTRPRDHFTTSLFLLSRFTFVCLPALTRVFSLWRLPFRHQLGFCDLITGWDKKHKAGKQVRVTSSACLFPFGVCSMCTYLRTRPNCVTSWHSNLERKLKTNSTCCLRLGQCLAVNL